jgi:glucose-1-phosphate thymidylyltransferase
MIYYPLETLAGMGITEVLVILGGRSVGDIVELLGDGSQFGFDLTYRYQRGPLGIAHGIGLARKWVGRDDFCVVLGDNVLRGPALDAVAREFQQGVCGAGTLLYEVPDPERFGVAELDSNGRVVRFEEKPSQPKSNLIPIGVYFLRPEVFGVIDRLKPSARGEFEITDVLNHYIPRDGLFWHHYTGQWIDAGTVESLLRAAQLVGADALTGKLVPPVSHMAAEPRLLKRVRRVATNGHANVNGGTNGNGHANGNGGTNGKGHTNGVLPQIATVEAV